MEPNGQGPFVPTPVSGDSFKVVPARGAGAQYLQDVAAFDSAQVPVFGSGRTYTARVIGRLLG